VSGEVPMEIQDIEHCGIEVDSKIKCFHGDDPIKKVAFEGVDTGRRFIACKNAKPCKFRIWYEPEWPATLQRALQQLWGMVQTNQKKNEETEALVNQMMLEKMTFAAANASVTQEKNEVVQKKMQLELDVADMKDKYQRKMKGMKRELQCKEKWLMMSVSCNVTVVAVVICLFAMKLIS
jgi:hypothetical protein